MSFRCFSEGWSRLERNELTCLCALEAKSPSSPFLHLVSLSCVGKAGWANVRLGQSDVAQG